MDAECFGVGVEGVGGEVGAVVVLAEDARVGDISAVDDVGGFGEVDDEVSLFADEVFSPFGAGVGVLAGGESDFFGVLVVVVVE